MVILRKGAQMRKGPVQCWCNKGSVLSSGGQSNVVEGARGGHTAHVNLRGSMVFEEAIRQVNGGRL